MENELCGVCGGDGRIANSFAGATATCPACHGTGRRSYEPLMRDVTKTKPSHYRPPNKAQGNDKHKDQGPTTLEGMKLAAEVQACPTIASDTKAKLTREIADHEATHGKCTQTFVKKIRKQIRPPSP